MKRTPVRKVSAKRLAKNGGKMFSTISAPKKVRSRRARSKGERERIYGPKGRVEFVKSLPCAACGVVGYSENAHLTPKGEKGTGYKGDCRFIAPLCAGPYSPRCHMLFDSFHSTFAAKFPAFSPAKAAAECESAWQLFTGSIGSASDEEGKT